MSTMTTLLAMLFLLSAGANRVRAGETTTNLDAIQDHLDDMANYEHFKAKCLNFANKEVTQRATRARAFLKVADLSEAFFDGKMDQDGLPDSEGILSMDRRGWAEEREFVRGSGNTVWAERVEEVEGTFTAGRLEGPAVVKFADLGRAYFCFRKGVRHGPFYRKGGLTDLQRKYHYPEVKNGSETVGLYLDGLPHSHWWHRQGDIQTLYYSTSPDDDSFLLFYGPSARMGSNRAVSYLSDGGGTGGKVRNVTSVEWDKREGGLGGVWKVASFDTDHSEQSQKLVVPAHLVGRLDKYDRRLLTAFQHWQPILHRRLSAPTYIRDLYRFFDPLRNATFDSVYVTHHVLQTAARAHPECLRFARMRIPPFGSVRATLAAGFPGSGNFWFFNMFHYLTGLATENRPCSICDRNVVVPSHMSPIEDLDAGYGNSDYNVNFVRPTPTLTHRLRELRINGGRMLLIMRNPYEAIISWWNHLRSMDAGGAGLDAAALKTSLESDAFCKFAVGEAKLWRQLNLDVLTMSTELLVVHYEDMVRDSIGKMLEALLFLKVPEHRERTECTKLFGPKRPRTTGQHLEEGENPFCAEARVLLDEAIVEVEQALGDTGRPVYDRHKFKYHSKSSEKQEL